MIGILRGSATINLAPLAFARKTRVAMRGWAIEVLEPMIKMQSAPSISSMELVIAPLPNTAASPATVEECQSRAQWSILFVPIAARVNFCKT